MKLGDYRVEVVPDTEFWLDGGAMFGVVPRNLWAAVCPPDESNRIRMNMNCLFVETGKDRILIETGIGDKWSPKHAAMYGITRQRSLSDSLFAIAGIKAEEISIVVNTHLHFDHAGGNTRIDEESDAIIATFPNARYMVSRAEYDNAGSPNERDRASYLDENWRPLKESDQLELMAPEYEVVAGLTMETIPGHSRTMQCPKLERDGQVLFGFADLVPMRAHLKLPWIMGYDLYPSETLEAKKRLIPQAAREKWLCLFYHDPDEPLCRIVDEGREPVAVPLHSSERVQL